MSQVSSVLFEIASTNRFYSKVYADLYGEIITTHSFMREPFDSCLNQFTELFDTIEYVEPSADYDAYCKINKINEKRKSISTFFIHLMNANIIPKEKIVEVLRTLVFNIYKFVRMENKKNEVDELAENVAILFTKEIYEDDTNNRLNYELIEGKTISSIIEIISMSDTKVLQSITKKTIFKFMDLTDM